VRQNENDTNLGDRVMEEMTLDMALKRIVNLEEENKKLREELEYFKGRRTSGRQKHNEKWMGIYKNFVICYEGGMRIQEIAEKIGVSKRTMYRYKAYYDKMKG
jgi:helix-turn-helix domain of resolvase